MRPARKSGPHDTAGKRLVRKKLLAWYDLNARELPWRIGPRQRAAGIRPNAYHVWLSEVMLQQTTVAAVKPYFKKFVSKWPSLADLAAAKMDEIMQAWAGLGYYSRARNLKATADWIASSGGCFPETAEALRSLPGIGGYTAAAIASIAFDRAAPVVDGNVERVISRLFRVETALPAAKRSIVDHQTELTPTKRPGDFAQAMMDLGALVCTPKQPACDRCPLGGECAAAAAGSPERYPIRAARKERPTRRGVVYVAIRRDGAVLLRRRPPKGLLGGMSEIPSNGWAESRASRDLNGPFGLEWRQTSGRVVHVFTHFRLELDIFRADVGTAIPAPEDCWWSAPSDLKQEALPSVMRKVIEAALPGPAQSSIRPRRPSRAG